MKFIHELSQKTFSAFQRFPICMLWAVAGSLFFIVNMDDKGQIFDDHFRWSMIFILGVSWLVGTAFFAEQFASVFKKIGLKILILFLLALYCCSLPENGEDAHKMVMNRWLLLFLAGHVFVFFAPFLSAWDDIAFWNYLKNILLAIGRSILFSAVLFGGLALALAASDTLFSLEVDGYIYLQLFVFCLGIVNTCIYLSDFPQYVQKNRKFVFNKALAVFVKYILLPLLLLYFVILYLYGFKILINWELPEGWLSGLICALAIIGFIVQIIINPWKDRPSLLIRKFYPWFYYFILPILLLLFVAVFRRIADYNFTESRYLLMLLAFWILGMCIYLILAKGPQMRVLPISLFILILFSGFGPWSAYNVSIDAQLHELKEIYANIDTDSKKMQKEEAERFQSIVFYLAQRNKMDEVLTSVGFESVDDFEKYSSWTAGWEILDSLGIEVLPPENLDQTEEQYFHYYRNESVVLLGQSFSGFAEVDYNFYHDEVDSSSFSIKWNGADAKIYQEDEVLFSLSLDSILEKNLRRNYNLLGMEPEKFEFEFVNENGRFKLLFTTLNFETKQGEIKISSAKAFLFFDRPK